jgi:hypothetical protein
VARKFGAFGKRRYFRAHGRSAKNDPTHSRDRHRQLSLATLCGDIAKNNILFITMMVLYRTCDSTASLIYIALVKFMIYF